MTKIKWGGPAGTSVKGPSPNYCDSKSNPLLFLRPKREEPTVGSDEKRQRKPRRDRDDDIKVEQPGNGR